MVEQSFESRQPQRDYQRSGIAAGARQRRYRPVRIHSGATEGCRSFIYRRTDCCSEEGKNRRQRTRDRRWTAHRCSSRPSIDAVAQISARQISSSRRPVQLEPGRQGHRGDAPQGGFFQDENGQTAFTHGVQFGVTQGTGNLQRDAVMLQASRGAIRS